MNISFILPSRNNLKYLKWSYAAIRKNQGAHNVQICVADDASTDGTNLWLEETAKTDPELSFMINQTGERLGHTILYDMLVNSFAKHELCIIYHADMYLCPGALDAIEKHMYRIVHHDHVAGGFEWIPEYKTITSLTRVEPPLHPDGVEKVLWDLGTEPENFKEDDLLKHFRPNLGVSPIDRKKIPENKTTEGVFAPWAFFKQDFREIGGHDPLFAPQSKEDSDIFNRFQLNGVKFIQTWEGFVYHMTCRGSRYNPTLTTPGTDSDEWTKQNNISAINFIRKWGSYVKHDEYMKPIIPHKYDIGFVVTNSLIELVRILEPWCTRIYTDMSEEARQSFVASEQKRTRFDMSDRVPSSLRSDLSGHQIIVRIDAKTFTSKDWEVIQNLSDIIADSGEEDSTMKVGNLELIINKIIPLENELIICKK